MKLVYPPRASAPRLVQPGRSFSADLSARAFENLTLEPVNDRDADAGPLRIAMVSSYAPRQCGIATFAADVEAAIRDAQPGAQVDIWPIHDASAGDLRGRPGIIEGNRASYREAARAIDRDGADLVILQHEFGLFGGPAGNAVLDFVTALAAPLVVTFHTVLAEPDEDQRQVMTTLVERASRLVVMSERSRDVITRVYRADPECVTVLEHGVPDRPFGRAADFKARLGIAGPLLLTFGLLGPGKGIESAIRALPAIVAEHPAATYCIAGATHPNLVSHEGERYREGLAALADELGVSAHIRWINRFLEIEELLDLIEAADIYITPYRGAQQATSGTLAYAVALGKAVISTPYVHAQDLLADGHGVLVPFGDPEAIAREANALLGDPAKLETLQLRAYARGRAMTWRRYGEKLVGLSEAVRARPATSIEPAGPLPLEGVIRLSDDCGILQHGAGGIPDRNHGYCIDDNARALLLMNRLGPAAGRTAVRLASIYASFVNFAWNEERQAFRNFMDYSRRWLEDEGSEDSNGRTLWVLGATAVEAQEPRLRAWAASLHDKSMSIAKHFHAPRATAFAMLGAAHRLAAEPLHQDCLETLRRGGDMLMALLESARRPDWAWFEAMLAYDNARLPEAMIRAGTILDRPKLVDEGLDTLSWIAEQQSGRNKIYRPVGTGSFGRKYEAPLPFDQQPLEAWAMIDACATAFEASGERRWIEIAESAYAWYLGGNDRGIAVGDTDDGSCYDGLTPHGANLNSGAESVLAFQLATLSMGRLLSGAR